MHSVIEADKQVVIATVRGMPVTELPHDLFIPPDALEVLLDSFSGPLDLLLYLIRRQNVDIMDIPILKITRQYMQYIELMEKCRLELAAEYLVMAATLAEIKSRMLLPPVPSSLIEDEDPRMSLVRRLQAYEQFKNASLMLDNLMQSGRDVYPVQISVVHVNLSKPVPEVNFSTLIQTMASLMSDRGLEASHAIQREVLSVRARMGEVLMRIQKGQVIEFTSLYLPEENRMGLVVSLLAILELAKQSLLIIMQASTYAPIYIKAIDG